MEFCPKCDSVLLPKRVGRRMRGVCSNCGYKGKLIKPKSYKISKRGKGVKEVMVVEGKRKRKLERPEISHEEMKPEYYEEYYE